MTANGKRVDVVSARQRVVVLTFDTVEAAEAWDAAGQPIELPTTGHEGNHP
jgi:hypothetical protein